MLGLWAGSMAGLAAGPARQQGRQAASASTRSMVAGWSRSCASLHSCLSLCCACGACCLPADPRRPAGALQGEWGQVGATAAYQCN